MTPETKREKRDRLWYEAEVKRLGDALADRDFHALMTAKADTEDATWKERYEEARAEVQRLQGELTQVRQILAADMTVEPVETPLPEPNQPLMPVALSVYGVVQEVRQLRLGLAAERGVLVATVAQLGGMVEGRPTERVNFLQRITELREAESSLARVEAARAALEELVQAILASVREDEKGEQWTIRAFLDKRGVYHENMSGSRRLVAEACQSVLAAKAEAR